MLARDSMFSKVLGYLPLGRYTIIKVPNSFPHIEPGSDVDIFIEDIGSFLETIRQSELSSEFIFTPISSQQCHVDYYVKDSLEFRLDLYASVPDYRMTPVNFTLFNSCIRSCETKKFSCEGCSFALEASVVDLFHQNFIRLIEFQEFFQRGISTKQAHGDAFEAFFNSLSSEKSRTFLEFVASYTSLPPAFNKRSLEQLNRDLMEINDLKVEKIRILNSMLTEYEELSPRIDTLLVERQTLLTEREEMMQERQTLLTEREEMMQELQTLLSKDN
jgi:hypothetical protein